MIKVRSITMATLGNIGKQKSIYQIKADPNLQRFELKDAKRTETTLGKGSYGSVEEIKLQNGLVCAGKIIHEVLLDTANEGAQKIADKYLAECQLMSDLRHPNITQFLGLCFFEKIPLPVLIMEKLYCSLDNLLETAPNIPLSLKRSMLEDVARGLLYLHKYTPQIVHRDLSAKNVLLTNSFSAKITDLGNSRIVKLQPGTLAKTLSQFPGTLSYMPPEAQDDLSRYGPSLDIFSFGHLGLFTALQVFPGSLLQPTFHNSSSQLVARSEVERRKEYFDLLEANLPGGAQHPLVLLIKRCLKNIPDGRPTARDLLAALEEMKTTIEGPYDSNELMKAHVMKQVVIARSLYQRDDEMRKKDKEIERLLQLLDQTEGSKVKETLQSLRVELGLKDTQLKQMEKELKQANDEKTRLYRELQFARAQPVMKKESSQPLLPNPIYDSADVSRVRSLTDPQQPMAAVATIPEPVSEIDRQKISITQKLGTSVFSDVFEAVWNKSTVAMKALKPGVIPITQFAQEAAELKTLRHPNIIPVYGFCMQKEPILILMEFVKGGNLLTYLQGDGKSLNHTHLVNIAQQIATGMAYLEEKDYPHGSLAARNVFVGENLTCKIGDVGIARHIYTRTSAQVGYIKRTALEAIRHKRFTIKSDIWSFGIVLYEIFTYGQIPYQGMSNRDVFDRVKQGYRMPKTVMGNCPDKIYELMLNCWKEDPAERYTFHTIRWQLEDFYENLTAYDYIPMAALLKKK